MIKIQLAQFPQDLEAVIAIFREYIASASVSLAFQEYEAEFATLPGKYDMPNGRLLLAWQDGQVVGCAALRQVDRQTCEMKRVYVRPAARGQELGRALVVRILEEARAAGYSRLCLDVLPEFTVAQRIYETLGFVTAAPVTFNPVPGTKFLALDL
jgi:putative acetyltransferase